MLHKAPDPRSTNGEGPWPSATAAAASEGSTSVLVESSFLLYMINEALVFTAIMVQVLREGRDTTQC